MAASPADAASASGHVSPPLAASTAAVVGTGDVAVGAMDLEDDFDIGDLEDVMEEAPTAEGEGTPAAATHADEGEEEEEEEESGVVKNAAGQTGATGDTVALAAAAAAAAPHAAAAPAKPKKKRKAPSKKEDDERASKQAKHPPGSPSQGDPALASADALPPAFPLSALKKLVGQFFAPLPPSRIPPALPVVLGELGKLILEEVISEGLRVRAASAGGGALAQGRLQRGTSQQQHAATSEPLTPAILREAHRRLVNSGMLPSRLSAAAPLVGISTALEEEGALRVGRIRKPMGWRR